MKLHGHCKVGLKSACLCIKFFGYFFSFDICFFFIAFHLLRILSRSRSLLFMFFGVLFVIVLCCDVSKFSVIRLKIIE